MNLDANHLALIAAGSGLVGGLLGAIISGAFGLRSKRNEYVNDYYKTVVQRRTAAYEELERLIVTFKTAVNDRDNRSYHLPFNSKDLAEQAQVQVGLTMAQGLWLTDECFAKVRELNILQFQVPEAASEIIEFGKTRYSEIAQLRESLEVILAADMLELHEVRKFLKSKKGRRRGLELINLRGPSKN